MEPAEKIIFSIVPSSDITQNDLDSVNQWRRKVSNEDRNNKFFFAKDPTGNILAFGILRVTNIDFHQKTYPVFEFISLTATVKRKGYGTLLLNKIKEYSHLQGRTLLGFCTSELVPFYLKAGLEVIQGETDRFSFQKDRWSFPGETPGVAIIAPGADGLFREMKKYPEEIAFVTRHKKS